MSVSTARISPEAPSLMALYSIECIASLLSLALNALLLDVLRKFSVFHDHLRVICLNITSTVFVASVYSLLRAILGIAQLLNPSESAKESDSLVCPFGPRIPTSICMLLVVFSLSLGFERFYASINYAQYELMTVERGVRVVLSLMWIPCGIFVVWGILNVSRQSSLIDCVSVDDRLTPLHRNLTYAMSAFFHFVCAGLFFYLTLLNRQRQTEYIKHHYRSLSTRFQIGENLRTCGVLQPLHLFFGSYFSLMFLTDIYIRRDGVPDVVHKESLYLMLPIFCSLFMLIFIGRDSVLKRKALQVTKELCNMGNDRKLLESA